jgi:hypothetical protein
MIVVSPRAGSEAVEEFDLRGSREGRSDFRVYLHLTILIVGLIDAGSIGFSIYQAWVASGLSRLVRPQDLFFLGGAAVFFTLVVMMFLVTGPAAERCTWDPAGFTFHYANGRNRRYLWTDSKLRLTISETTRKMGSVYGTNALGLLPPNHLPRELYMKILQESRRRGLRVTTQTFGGLSGTRAVSNQIRASG